jgi:hypothetical protein
MAFLLEGAYVGGQVVSQANSITVDDSQIGSLTLWSSQKTLDVIQQPSATPVAVALEKVAGFATLPTPCPTSTTEYFRLVLRGATEESESWLATDKLAVKVLKAGTYLFSIFYNENVRTMILSYNIQKRTEPLKNNTGTLLSTAVASTNQQHLFRVFKLAEGEEVDFRLLPTTGADMCSSIVLITWTVEELQ